MPHRLFSAEFLPHRPYCSNDKKASNIRPVNEALSYAYIQPNPPGLLRWLVFDIDLPNAEFQWQMVSGPAPNLIVINPASGHAHYFYCLKSPVCMTDAGRPHPKRLGKTVNERLGFLLKADPNYARLMAKNPLHFAHITIVTRNEPYELVHLLEAIPNRDWRVLRQNEGRTAATEGRNCSLFDDLRRWGYAWVGDYAKNSQAFIAALQAQAEKMNQFAGHVDGNLSESEVRSIVRSVAKFCLTKYEKCRGNDPSFIEKQSNRGRQKGAKVRDEFMPKAMQMAASGMPQRKIAEALGVAQKTVSNWLSKSLSDISNALGQSNPMEEVADVGEAQPKDEGAKPPSKVSKSKPKEYPTTTEPWLKAVDIYNRTCPDWREFEAKCPEDAWGRLRPVCDPAGIYDEGGMPALELWVRQCEANELAKRGLLKLPPQPFDIDKYLLGQLPI